MINWIVTSSVLILVVAGLRFLLRGKISLRLQYALWLVVLFRLMVPFEIGTSDMSLMNVVEQVPVVQEMENLKGVEAILYYEESGTVYGTRTWENDSWPTVAENRTEAEFHQMEKQLELRDLASAAWKVGIAVMAALFLTINLRFKRKLEKGRTPVAVQECVLPVYVSNFVETPCLFGLLEPAIYVTPEAAADETVLRHTIEHETTHYIHKDHIWSLLRCVALCIHWYNPLVWWAAKLSKDDAELACDEVTVTRLGEEERYAYGKTLIEMTKPGRNVLLGTATTMTGSKGSLRERIERIAKKPKMAAYTLAAVLVIAAVAAVCTMTGAENRDFEEWLRNVKAEEIGEAYVGWDIGINPKSQVLSEENLTELCGVLNRIDRSQLRKEKSTGGNDSYILIVPWEDEGGRHECLFKVQDDVSAAVSFDYDTGIQMIEEGMHFHIHSPELVDFIEDCAIADTMEDEGKTIGKTELVRVDIDNDGTDETVYVEEYLHTVYRLTVEETDGTVIWEESSLSLSHPGWGTYLLYEKDGQTAMVRYSPYASTGFASYEYQIFTLEDGKVNILQKDEVSFEVGRPETYPAELDDFLLEINEIMDSCVILLSTEGGKLVVGPASPEKLQNSNKAILMEPIDVSLLESRSLPEAAIQFAKNYVQTQVDHHNEIGNIISSARITDLEPISTGTAAENSGINMYRLEYRLLPENPDQVMLAGGMAMDGDEITERGSTGQPYLLLHYRHGADGTIWTCIGFTNTDSIQFDYGTQEMLQEYGNAYTAAAMEIWNRYFHELKNEEAVDTAEPSAAVTNLFNYSDDVFLGLTFADEGDCNSYIADGWEYREQILPLLGNCQWSKLKAYSKPGESAVTITSGDGRRQLLFWSDDVVEYRRAGESFFWKGEPLQQDVPSIAKALQEQYYNVDAAAERIRFYTDGTAEDAAKSFIHSVFGSHLMNLARGNEYGISAYEVVDWSCSEIGEDETAVTGYFTYAFVPLFEDSVAVWAGNTSKGTGAYKGMLTRYNEFVLDKQPDGYWRCTGFGTGGYRWGQQVSLAPAGID